jgi:hypothetical protein
VKNLTAVDVADAGHDGLVHQEQADWRPTAVNPLPRLRRLGVLAQWIRTEPRENPFVLLTIDQLALVRPVQINRLLGALKPCAHSASRRRRGILVRAKPAE